MSKYSVNEISLLESELGSEILIDLISDFDSGDEDVNSYFHKYSLNSSKRKFSKTYVYLTNLSGNLKILGYYTIVNNKIFEFITSSKTKFKKYTGNGPDKDRPPYKCISSSILIAQIGRNNKYFDNTHINLKVFLDHAFSNILEIDRIIGVRNVILDCKDELLPLYIKFGFVLLEKKGIYNKLYRKV